MTIKEISDTIYVEKRKKLIMCSNAYYFKALIKGGLIMRYYVDTDIENFKAWSGGKSTLDTIKEAGKITEFSNYMEEITSADEPWSETQINDFLWFNSDEIFQILGITPNGEDIEEIWDAISNEFDLYFSIVKAFLKKAGYNDNDNLDYLWSEYLIEEKDCPCEITTELPSMYNFDYDEQLEIIHWATDLLKLDCQVTAQNCIQYGQDNSYFTE